MIGKAELLETAQKVGLRPDVVEKDYVLGWTLAGIYAHAELRESWVFKGGTCLKKCYFETYRFSEDLDFTIKDAGHLDDAFLKRAFGEIGEWIYDQCGVEMPKEGHEFELFENPRGKRVCQGKLSYKGPVSPNVAVRRWPRIKLDLTADEQLVLPPKPVEIFHPYSDAPDSGITVLAYAYEEAFGEKVRALGERTRPRDLYDVVNLYRNTEARPTAAVILDVLTQKCAFKQIGIPNLAGLEPHRAGLEAAWGDMLAHQLPALPPVAAFWDVLPEFFSWLLGGQIAEAPAAYAMAAGETVIRQRSLSLPVSGAAQSYLEIIRFAGANCLCVELGYQGTTRRIEPYSLRMTQDGNVVLHAHSLDKNEHRSYRVDRIESARSLNQTFVPRHAVELTPSGPINIVPSAARASSGGIRTTTATHRTATRAGAASGVTYVYQCPMCQKKFRRKTQDGKLNPHKAPGGYNCSGRTGFLVATEY